MEEKFFLCYFMNMDPFKVMQLKIYERRWLIERLIKQKEKENEAVESAKRKAKTR